MVKRINYFDVIKTLSVFLIVYVHYPWISGSVGSNVSMLITIIGVPLFMMVNGALLLSKNLDYEKHFNKIKSYFIGLVFLKLLILLICIVTKRFDIGDHKFFDLFIFLFTEKTFVEIPTEHLWFMYMLIKIYLLFPLIYYVIKEKPNVLKYIFVFCLVFSFGIEGLNDISLILNKFCGVPIVSFDAIIMAYSPFVDILQYMTYFILGYYLHKCIEKANVSKRKIVGLICLYILGLSLIFLSRYMQTGYILKGPYMRVLKDYTKIGCLIMACSVFIILSQLKFKSYKFFNYIGSKTLNIYYVHMVLVAYASTYLLEYFKNFAGMKLNIVRTLVVIIASIIITELLKKVPIIKKIFV